ncbi:MAG TPA: cupredoxin domain-containing protein [Pyrinomonadaceae bacterium]|nr:cupredoxin domain-containing protein [Pyrinomonadaceae bacterium]
MAKRLMLWAAVLTLIAAAGCTTRTEVNQNANTRANANANANARTTANTNAAATATPAATPGAAAKSVDVKLTEFEIEMPASVAAGSTAFRVTNEGKAEHNFEIEGQGVKKKFDANPKPGETKTLQVELRPGTYKVYCPVGNHEGRGMTLNLTVSQ